MFVCLFLYTLSVFFDYVVDKKDTLHPISLWSKYITLHTALKRFCDFTEDILCAQDLLLRSTQPLAPLLKSHCLASRQTRSNFPPKVTKNYGRIQRIVKFVSSNFPPKLDFGNSPFGSTYETAAPTSQSFCCQPIAPVIVSSGPWSSLDYNHTHYFTGKFIRILIVVSSHCL